MGRRICAHWDLQICERYPRPRQVSETNCMILDGRQSISLDFFGSAQSLLLFTNATTMSCAMKCNAVIASETPTSSYNNCDMVFC